MEGDLRVEGVEVEEQREETEKKKLLANERTEQEIEKKMSANEGESRPSFMVGDQDEAESPVLNNANQDEDRDHFNQNMSQKPPAFDLAEKRRRLR